MGLLDGLFGGSFEKQEARGDVLMEERDFPGAAQAYRSALRKCERKDPEAAVRIRTKVDEADDRVLEELTQLIHEHLEDGEPEVAREQLEIARNFTREHPGKYDAQLSRLERAIDGRVRSDRAQAHRDYEERMQKALRDEDASEDVIEFEQVLNTLPPEDVDEAKTYGPHFRRGFLALARGETETAVEALELATHERPESAIVYEQWGKALELAGRSPEARRAYGKALQRDPRRRDARFSLATILDSLEGKDRQAIEILAEGIDEVPAGEPELRMTMGAIHLGRGRAAEAIGEIDRTLEILPDGPADLWHLKGTAHEMMGELEEAEEAFGAASRADSRNPRRRVHYVEFCLRHRRSLEKAEEALVSICHSCGFPGDPQTMATFSYYLALLTAARGKPHEALAAVARALGQGVPPDFEERFLKLRRDLEAAAKKVDEDVSPS